MTVSGFRDHFSGHAADYRSYRPVYPSALFDYLAGLPARRQLVWDCGTGNGQAAVELVKHFDRVIATDASAEQVHQAEPHPRIDYRVCPAEDSCCESGSVDLVVVAQALHWFDFDRFYAEVRRAGRPDSFFAAISYGVHSVTPAVDAVLEQFQREFVGPFWPPERRFVDDGYGSIPFPFAPVEPPAFDMTATWPLAAYLGYLRTWSATKQFQSAHGFDPAERLAAEFAAAWGEAGGPRLVRWALSVRAGRIH